MRKISEEYGVRLALHDVQPQRRLFLNYSSVGSSGDSLDPQMALAS